MITSKLINNLKFRLVLSGCAITIVLIFGVLTLQSIIFKNSATLYLGTIRNQAVLGEYSQVKLSLAQSLLIFSGVSATFLDSKQKYYYGEKTSFSFDLNAYFDPMGNEVMASFTFYYNGVYGIVVSALMSIFSYIILFFFFKKTKDKFSLEIDLQRRIESVNTLTMISKQVSHDLASPLSAMNNLAHLLNLNSDQDSLFKAIVKRIRDISSDLSKMHTPNAVEDAIDFSELNELASIQIPRLVEEKNLEFQERFKIKFTNNCQHNSVISISKKDLLRILSNLINNSADASNQFSSIQIVLNDDNLNIIFLVVDEGKGIPENILNKIQIEGFNFNKKGTGLGISGARKILQKVGGSIEIFSEFGVGTTVKVSIPKS